MAARAIAGWSSTSPTPDLRGWRFRAAAGEIEDLGGFVARGNGATRVVAERDCLLDQFHVRRLSGTGMILEPDVQVRATVKRELGDRRLEQVTTDHRDRPWERAALQELAIRVERFHRRRQTE